jgi:hypothetical protein
MVREYTGEAFERPKTWLGRLFDTTPEECYQTQVRIKDIVKIKGGENEQ